MAQKHYSPPLSRFIVSVLYHEAKARKIPMTQLTDSLLRKSLVDTAGWKTAESMRVAEETSTVPTSDKAA
jgi:hypothetical protein